MSNKRKSFTLIELLVVIVIIGILAGIIMISTSSSIDKANIAKLKVFEESIANDLAANMVSRWKLDEINGITTPDAWGSNTGTLYGTNGLPQLKLSSECVSNACFEFDGIDDYISYTDDGFSNERTVSFWFNAEDLSKGECLLGKNIDGATNWVFYRNSPWSPGYLGFLYYYTKNDNVNSNILPSFYFYINKWYLINLISDAKGNYRVYINGELKISEQAPDFKSWRDVPSYFLVGAMWQFFDGSIDDVRIYDAILTNAQIKQNYIAGLDSLLSSGNILKEDYNNRINELAYE